MSTVWMILDAFRMMLWSYAPPQFLHPRHVKQAGTFQWKSNNPSIAKQHKRLLQHDPKSQCTKGQRYGGPKARDEMGDPCSAKCSDPNDRRWATHRMGVGCRLISAVFMPITADCERIAHATLRMALRCWFLKPHHLSSELLSVSVVSRHFPIRPQAQLCQGSTTGLASSHRTPCTGWKPKSLLERVECGHGMAAWLTWHRGWLGLRNCGTTMAAPWLRCSLPFAPGGHSAQIIPGKAALAALAHSVSVVSHGMALYCSGRNPSQWLEQVQKLDRFKQLHVSKFCEHLRGKGWTLGPWRERRVLKVEAETALDCARVTSTMAVEETQLDSMSTAGEENRIACV